jgi:phosphomannomutase
MIKFGTDGWRSLMTKDFTIENVAIVAQAYADYLKEARSGKGPARIVIGYDCRKNSEVFAKRFAEVLLANGVAVVLSDRACPTPAVSFTIVDGKFDGGIVITASHNPADYNGVKLKTDFGGSAEKDITDGVERHLLKSPVLSKPFMPGIPELRNLNDKYLINLKRYLQLDLIRAAPYRVLIDSMHGVGNGHIQNILAGGKIQVTTLRGERDVTFGGTPPEPIPKNLTQASELMKKGGYDLCVATDGDADRVGAIRPGGEFISPGILLSLIMIHFVEDLKRTGSVVTTISNTALIYRVAKKLGLKIHETPIGFKYVCDIMRRENVLIGGEESGGIGFQNYLYERDGLLSGLLVMQMMAMRRQSFEEILNAVEKEFGKLYYVRNDLDYPNELKSKLFKSLTADVSIDLHGHRLKERRAQDGVKYVLDDDSWLLFRLSGTEPILRIYSEATSQDLAESLVRQGREFAFNLP